MPLIYSHDFRPKMIGEAYLLVFQQNSEQNKRKVGCHNLHQLELNTKPTKENVTTAKAWDLFRF